MQRARARPALGNDRSGQACGSPTPRPPFVLHPLVTLIIFAPCVFPCSSYEGSMALSPIGSYFVLVISAATLFYVALTDLREFKIRNELLLVLAGLYVLFAVLSGHWRTMYWNVALAAVMFAIMLYFYAQNLMGGGD